MIAFSHSWHIHHFNIIQLSDIITIFILSFCSRPSILQNLSTEDGLELRPPKSTSRVLEIQASNTNWVSTVLGTEPRALHTLGKHPAN